VKNKQKIRICQGGMDMQTFLSPPKRAQNRKTAVLRLKSHFA